MTRPGSDLARPGPVPATRPAPWDYAAHWGTRGYITDLGGPVYWIEFAADHGRNQPTDQPETQDRNQPGALPPIVFVHGLGGSHLNWCLLGPHLTAGRRVVALDLRGFGLTPGLRVNSTVQANARLLDRFITEVIGTPVILAGNSMGGLITILETAANPDAIDGVVLIDPALPLPLQKPDWEVSAQFLVYALPGLGDLAARRRPATPAQASARARVFLASARSLLRVLGRRQRYARVMAGIDVPVLLIGGDADRLVPVAAIRQAGARNPRWETVILAGVGHTPQLEVPGAVAVAIRGWLDRHAT